MMPRAKGNPNPPISLLGGGTAKISPEMIQQKSGKSPVPPLTRENREREKESRARARTGSFRDTDTKDLNPSANKNAFHKAGSAAVIDFNDNGEDLIGQTKNNRIV